MANDRWIGAALVAAAVAVVAARAEAPAKPPDAPTIRADDPLAATLKRGDAYARLIEAGLAVARGRSAEAVRDVNDAVALDPGSAELHAQGASLLGILGRRGDAERLARRALELDPNQTQALRVLADLSASRSFGPKADPSARAEAIRLYERLAADDPEAPDDIWSALTRLKLAAGDAPGAVVAARKLVARRPGDPDALRLLDQTLVAAGKTQEALDLTLAWLKTHPDDADLVPLVVEMARETGAWGTIESLCDELLAADADNTRARALRGEARLRQGRPTEALEDLELARATAPRDPLVRLHVAAAFQALNRLADATQLAESLVAEFPDNTFVRILLAETLARRGETTPAREEYAAALRGIVGDDESAALRRDELRGRLVALEIGADRIDDAKATLATLERPETPEALRLRARAAMAFGDPKETKRLAKMLVDAEPDDAALLDGEADLKLGRAARATESFDRAVRKGGPALRGDVAAILRRNGRDAAAEAELRAWIASSPDDAEGRLALGAWLDRTGKFTEAETELRAAIRLAPKAAEPLNDLGYSLADRGERLDEAVALIQQALVLDPWNGAYLDSLGWAYFRQGRAVDARDPLERAVREFPKDATVLEHLGDVYAALDDPALAQTFWRRALDAGPDSKDALERKLATASAPPKAESVSPEKKP